MRYIISGKNLDITEGLRSAVTEKLGKLERYFTPDTEVHVTLSVEKERQKIEVTIPVKGNIIRSEQSSTDMYVSIDLVEEVIERQLRKYKTRVLDKKVRATERIVDYAHEDAHPESELDLDRLMDELSEDEIVRRKETEFTPMTEEEALIQIDLLGHDFFAYTDRDTNLVHILYRREDGGYGLLTQKED